MKKVFTNIPSVLSQLAVRSLFELDGEKRYTLTIEEEKRQRTLTANGYYWSLLYQLAVKLNTSSQELHDTLVKQYSEPLLIPLPQEADPNGYFRYFEKYKETTINDRLATYYKVYKGSSEMDTNEFNILLKGLISECKECDIETLTPSEIDLLKRN